MALRVPLLTRRFKRLVLHIGQHKTGTTSLQDTLARNRVTLRAAGILYPKLGPWRSAHHALAPALLGKRQTAQDVLHRLGPSAEGRSRHYLAQLHDMARRGDCDTVVLSSEAFFRRVTARSAAELAEALSAIAENIEVVCYLRHPAAFVLSAISTQVQRTPFIRAPHPALQITALRSYGKAKQLELRVHPYVLEQLHNKDVVDDFAHRHLPGGTALVPQRARARLNQTLSAEAMVIAQDFGRRADARAERPITLYHRMFRALLQRVDRRTEGFTKPRLLPGLDTEIVKRTEGFDKIRNRWRCTFPGLDYAVLGTGSDIDFAELTEIGDYCIIDDDRLRRMRRSLRWIMPR